MTRYLLAALLCAWTASAELRAQSRARPASPPSPAAPAASPTPDALAPFRGRHASLISGSGIGLAKIGMPVAVLEKKLGAPTIEAIPGYLGDFDALRFSLNGEPLFSLLHLPDFTPRKVGDIATSNPRFATKEGLHPGLTLEEAEKIAGKATLYYSDNNEAEEFVTFESQPFPNIRIRPKSPDGAKAGVYETATPPAEQPDSAENAQEEAYEKPPQPDAIEGRVYSTQKFKPGAIIESITVSAPASAE